MVCRLSLDFGSLIKNKEKYLNAKKLEK